MGKAVLHDKIYPATELVHESSGVFFGVEPTTFFSTVTG
jgi:hypothetical protein